MIFLWAPCFHPPNLEHKSEQGQTLLAAAYYCAGQWVYFHYAVSFVNEQRFIAVVLNVQMYYIFAIGDL